MNTKTKLPATSLFQTKLERNFWKAFWIMAVLFLGYQAWVGGTIHNCAAAIGYGVAMIASFMICLILIRSDWGKR